MNESGPSPSTSASSLTAFRVVIPFPRLAFNRGNGLPVSLFDQLIRTASRVHPEPGWWDRISRLKYCIRGLLAPRLTQKWFEILNCPELALIVQNHPHIFSKLQRCYLHKSSSPKSRFLALQDHYQFVASRLSDEAIGCIYGSTGLLLTPVPLSVSDALELRLRYYDSLSKEGEMSVALHECNTGQLLAALSFSILKNETGALHVFIGGLQGFTRPSQKERIVAITRALHGLRPKALLLFTLQQLAVAWGVNSIRAVRDSHHVYRHFRKRKKVALSYDQFWLESGGHASAEGFFTIPTASVERDLIDMKPSKRQMYRRRYFMLQDLASRIRDTVSRHTLPKTPSISPVATESYAVSSSAINVSCCSAIDRVHADSAPS